MKCGREIMRTIYNVIASAPVCAACRRQARLSAARQHPHPFFVVPCPHPLQDLARQLEDLLMLLIELLDPHEVIVAPCDHALHSRLSIFFTSFPPTVQPEKCTERYFIVAKTSWQKQQSASRRGQGSARASRPWMFAFRDSYTVIFCVSAYPHSYMFNSLSPLCPPRSDNAQIALVV